jgi:hypothetical protein
MNTASRDLIRKRIEGRPECGWLVGFRNGTSLETGKHMITRGFIRSINGDVARINTGQGTYLVSLDMIVYRYSKSE